ncbi:transposase IS605 OrfB family, partial [mine drainage metagenome]
ENRIRLLGIGDVKIKLTRPIKGTPKTITLKKINEKKWYVSIVCTNIKKITLPKTGHEIGIDLGVVNQVALSNGQLVEGQRFLRKSEDKLALHQQSLSRKKRVSKRRNKSRELVGTTHRKISNQRRDFNHKLSRELVNNFDLIVHEDLNIKNMSKSSKGTIKSPGKQVKQKSGLNKSINDAG